MRLIDADALRETANAYVRHILAAAPTVTCETYRDALEDMCQQFAYPGIGPSLITGGLSALEDAFAVLGWDDPHPVPERGCDEPGCTRIATCGTPTPEGYRTSCSEHAPWAKP